MMFADTNPDSSQLGLWVQCAGFVLTLIVGVLAVLSYNRPGKQTISPDPLRIQEAERFVTRENHELTCRALDSRIAGVEKGLGELEGKRRHDNGILFDKVSAIGNQVAGIEKSVDIIAKNTDSQITRLDELLQKKADRK